MTYNVFSGTLNPTHFPLPGAKQPGQKYFMTNNHTIEFDIVF